MRVFGWAVGWFKGKKNRDVRYVITVFPKGTIVTYNGIPCELLCDTPYYSETFRGRLATIYRGRSI